MCDSVVILLWQTIISQSLHISMCFVSSRLLKHKNMNISRHLKEHYVVLGKTFQSEDKHLICYTWTSETNNLSLVS